MEILPDFPDGKRISSLNHHLIIRMAAFLFHWFPEHCLIFTLERVAGVFCFFVCAMFYCQGLWLSGLRLNLDVMCVSDGWRERKRCSPPLPPRRLLLPAVFHLEITKSSSVCQSSSQIWALKRSHLVQCSLEGWRIKQGWWWVTGFPSSLLWSSATESESEQWWGCLPGTNPRPVLNNTSKC